MFGSIVNYCLWDSINIIITYQHKFMTTIIPQVYANIIKNHQNHDNPQLALSKQKAQSIQRYFQNKLRHKEDQESQHLANQAKFHADSIVKFINQEIIQGQLIIANEHKNVKDLLSHQERITKQEQKAKLLRMKRDQIQMKLDYLKSQVNPRLGNSKITGDLHISPHTILPKQQHEKIIEKLKKQHEEAEKKRRKYIQHIEQQKKHEDEKQRKKQQEQIEHERQQRKKKIEEKMQRSKSQQAKKIENQLQKNKELEEIKNKHFLYQKIQQRYNSQVVMPNLEERKKKLKELREITKLNMEEIRNHERQYTRRKQQNEHNISRANSNWKYIPPEKSERLARILEEEKIDERKKLQEKKRQLEDKINRQETFVAYLRQKFKPKIDNAKRQQVQRRSKKPEKREAIGNKLAGINYLEEAKKLAKKVESERPITNNQSNNNDTQLQTKQLKKAHTNYLVSNKNRDYQQLRRRKIQRITRSKGQTAHQKISFLQKQAQKINEQAKRKEQLSKITNNQIAQQEAVDLLLSSIKAKIGIMDIYNANANK